MTDTIGYGFKRTVEATVTDAQTPAASSTSLVVSTVMVADRAVRTQRAVKMIASSNTIVRTLRLIMAPPFLSNDCAFLEGPAAVRPSLYRRMIGRKSLRSTTVTSGAWSSNR